MPAAARCARCRARRRSRATTCVLSLDIKLQQVAEHAFGDRRGALVAIDPTTGEVLAFVSQTRLRPQSVRRRHRSAELGRAQQLARQAAPEPAAARRLPARLDDQAVPRALGARLPASARPTQTIFDPGYYQSPGSAHRFRDDKPGGHGYVDMPKSIIVSCDTYYYMLAAETDIDDHARLPGAVRLRTEDRHRHRRRAPRRAAFARSGSASASRAELPRGQPQVVSRRLDFRRHRPGLQRVHARPAGGGDRDDRQRRRLLTRRTWCRASRTSPPASRADRAETAHPVDVKPEFLAVIKNALIGVAREGTSAQAFVGTKYVSAGKTGTAQLFSVKQGEKYQAGASTSGYATTPGTSPMRRPPSRRSLSRCWSRTAASARRRPRRSRARCWTTTSSGRSRAAHQAR